MTGSLVLYHLSLLLIPLAALAFLRFRLTPALLLMAVLHHHAMEPMPGDCDPPPICCALAQSTEAEPGLTIATTARTFWLAPLPRLLIVVRLRTAKPAIRAPPTVPDLLPPAPWAPALRAA